jgi:hypothetical protein
MALNNIIYPPDPWQIPCYGSFLDISLTQPLREARDRWPLLTVETEVNGTQRIQMKEVLLWLFRCACLVGTRDFCPALAALVGPVQKKFFLTVQYFNPFLFITRLSCPCSVLTSLLQVS